MDNPNLEDVPEGDEAVVCVNTRVSFRVGRRWNDAGDEVMPPEWVRTLCFPRIKVWSVWSEDEVHSYALWEHLCWLCDRLEPHSASIREMRAEGWWMDIFCLWISRMGHGGPTLPPDLLARLGALGIEVTLDIYDASGDGVATPPI